MGSSLVNLDRAYFHLLVNLFSRRGIVPVQSPPIAGPHGDIGFVRLSKIPLGIQHFHQGSGPGFIGIRDTLQHLIGKAKLFPGDRFSIIAGRF